MIKGFENRAVHLIFVGHGPAPALHKKLRLKV